MRNKSARTCFIAAILLLSSTANAEIRKWNPAHAQASEVERIDVAREYDAVFKKPDSSEITVALLSDENRKGSQGQSRPENKTPPSKAPAKKTAKKKEEPAAPDRTSTKPTLVLDAGGHTSRVSRLWFTPDNRQLISFAPDQTIRFWDVKTGEPLRTLWPPLDNTVDSLTETPAALSADGSTLAIARSIYDAKNDRKVPSVCLISVPTGQITQCVELPHKSMTELALSCDGRYMACACGKTVTIYKGESGKPVISLGDHTDTVNCVAFSPNGQLLATGSDDHTARIWSTVDGRCTATLKGHRKAVNVVAWNSDSRTLATACKKMITLWSSDGKLLKSLDAHGSLQSLAFTANMCEMLITTNKRPGKGGYLLNTATGDFQDKIFGHGPLSDAAVSPDGTLCAVSLHRVDQIHIAKTSDSTLLHRIQGRGEKISECGWSPDGRCIGWDTLGNPDTKKSERLTRSFSLENLTFVDSSTESYLQSQTVQDSRKLEKSSTNKSLEVKSGDKIIFTWKVDPATDSRVCGYTFLPNKRVAVGTWYGRLHVLEIPSGKALIDLLGHTERVSALAPSPDGRFLLSASGDRTLRIWDPSKNEPLLSFFFAEKEWVAWTPEGYYATSPGGERLMGWRVDRGSNAMASFYPAAQFHKSLYRPDVIKAVLRAGNTAGALALADAERRHASLPANIDRIMPPQVLITSPDQPKLKINQPSLQIQAVATPVGDMPITAIRLILNGRPYQGSFTTRNMTVELTKAKPVTQTWDILLEPGAHQIVAKAETSMSYGLSDPLEVSYSPEKTELPKLYVLAVGISKYEVESMRLAFAAGDAQKVAQVFQQTASPLFRRVECKVLTDAQASRDGISHGLSWLKAQATQQDVSVIFYSGHGGKDSNGKFHILPVDFNPRDINATGVSEEQIKSYCQSTPGRILLLLDACHTGALGGDRRKDIHGMTDDMIRDLVNDDYGVMVMCSSMGREFSLESAEWGHGAFTKALTEGLQGKADILNRKVVYSSDLDAYVTERVKTLTNGRQHPVTQKPTSIRSFPISKP